MRHIDLRRNIFVFCLLLAMPLVQALSQNLRTTSNRPFLSIPAIEYPRVAKELNLRGVVKLLVTVAADGHVVRSEVMGGSPVFVPVVVEAISKSKWQPGPQQTKETIEVTFQPTKP